jgi:Zn-finger nucleic acid-binding protein
MAEVALHCPKCHAGMASFQRSGIMVEQCATCRGVFLTEAGLARLIDAGGAGHAMHTAPPAAVGPAFNGYHRQAYEGRHRRG